MKDSQRCLIVARPHLQRAITGRLREGALDLINIRWSNPVRVLNLPISRTRATPLSGPQGRPHPGLIGEISLDNNQIRDLGCKAPTLP